MVVFRECVALSRRKLKLYVLASCTFSVGAFLLYDLGAKRLNSVLILF